MANLHHLLSIKRRFTISSSFHVSSSNNFRLALGPPHKLLHSSFSLDNNTNNGQSSIIMYDDDYDKITNLNDVLEIFNGMINQRPIPSVVKFTRLLHHVTQLKHYSCSLDLFKQMCAFGFPVNKYTAGISIKCYCRLHRTKHGLTVLGLCFKQGVQLHVSTYNTLFKGFALNYTHEAESLFFGLVKGNQLNLASYKIMIKAICKIGYYYAAIGLTRLIDHGLLGGGGCKVDLVMYNTIFDSLCNDIIFIDDAFKLLKEMVFHKAIPPNVKTYNSLIYNLCKLGRWNEVCRMLKQMEAANIHPEVKTFNIIVDALCKQGKIDEAQLVINIMLETAYPPNIVAYNSLIDAYCWRHEMSKARSIFDSLASKCVKPNIVTYHKLLLGYSMDPNADEFADFYNSMPDAPRYNMLTLWFAYGECYHDRCYLSSIKIPFPNKHSYYRILEHACYKDALAFFRLMDRWNSEVRMYNILIEGAIKSRKFDDARRHFHDLVMKGIEPDERTYEAMVYDMANKGLYREAVKHYLRCGTLLD